MRRHWFFDFDGTLMDTRADIKAAWLAVIRACGRECPEFEQRYVTGPTLEETAKLLFPDDWTPQLIADFRANYGRLYDTSGFPNTSPYQGVEAMLRRLKAKGASIWISTNKRLSPTSLLVDKYGWRPLLDGILCSDMFLASGGGLKTKAELLALTVAEHGIKADDAVMAGDMASDISAGKANGFWTVGCTWGYGARADLEGADEIADSPDAIAK